MSSENKFAPGIGERDVLFLERLAETITMLAAGLRANDTEAVKAVYPATIRLEREMGRICLIARRGMARRGE